MSTKTHTHPGKCIEGTVFSTEQSHAKLAELGYTYRQQDRVWAASDGTVGGRLEWVPDYCNPDNFRDGTAFYLRSPFGGPLTPVLGEIPASLS